MALCKIQLFYDNLLWWPHQFQFDFFFLTEEDFEKYSKLPCKILDTVWRGGVLKLCQT